METVVPIDMRSSFLGLGLAGCALVGCLADNSLLICQQMKTCVVSDGAAPMSSSTDDAQAADVTTSSGDDSGSTSTDDGSSSSSGDATMVSEASTSTDATTPPVGTNLIVNGDFSQGTTGWGIVSGSAPIGLMGSALCVTAPTSQVTLAWPQSTAITPPVLSMAASYTFTYQAMASLSGLSVDAKVGHTTSPYTADFEATADAVTTSEQTFTHTFMPGQDDSSTGLAFTFTSPMAQNVCFQAVSLVPN